VTDIEYPPDDPFEEPAVAVSVVGIGDAGAATVEAIDTPTDVWLATVGDGESPPVEAVADSDFCILMGDPSERGVAERAATLLGAADGSVETVFVAEGAVGPDAAEHVDAILDGTDLLLPVDPERVDRQLVAGAVADLFECMLHPTVQDLGYGDVYALVGSAAIGASGEPRVGSLAVDHPVTGERIVDCSPGATLPSPDAQAVFLCCGPDRSLAWRTERLDGYDRPGEGVASLRDSRIHERYAGSAHVKRFRTAEATEAERRRLLTER
jgi:hypothetical protein